MTNRQDRRFANYIRVVCPNGASCAVQIRSGRICAQPQAARRVASTDGRNEGNEKSHFFKAKQRGQLIQLGQIFVREPGVKQPLYLVV